MKPLIIDVRGTEEYHASHVEGAINLPLGDLLADETLMKGYPKETTIIFYCRTGARSGKALEILRNLGFTDVTNGINQENVEKHLFTA